jgi:hypothetical protein
LNPTNKDFHAEATWTSGDKLWLRDFLPRQLPKARVLLFGYNSNVAFETSTAGVREQAENLLNRLKGKRKVCTPVIIFTVVTVVDTEDIQDLRVSTASSVTNLVDRASQTGPLYLFVTA